MADTAMMQWQNATVSERTLVDHPGGGNLRLCPDTPIQLNSESPVRRKREVGFMSEHTAEYLLVHRLHEIARQKIAHLLPMHFSGTREGAPMAALTMRGKVVKCFAIYARRLKIHDLGQTSVQMKINKPLFVAAAIGSRFGCPVLAGLPLVNGLHQFSLEAPCAWFRISTTWHEEEDQVFNVPLE